VTFTAPPNDPVPAAAGAAPSAARRRGDRGDAVARVVFPATGLFVVVLMGAIALFLVVKAAPAFSQMGGRFFTEKQWFPDQPKPAFGIAALAFGTVMSSAVALLIAVPVALGSALFVAEIARGRIGRTISSLVDLLAAVPSVVFGLWGVYYLRPRLLPVWRFLDKHVGFIPIFHSTSGYAHSILEAAVVLSVMIIPIVAALTREVFRQVPRTHREAALALGATRWEAIRLAVLPYGRSGIVGAVMLGLGRALGETIAVALILGGSYLVDIHLTRPGGATIASNIAVKFGEAGAVGREALIASGLVLFAITFAVNFAGRAVVRRAVES